MNSMDCEVRTQYREDEALAIMVLDRRTVQLQEGEAEEGGVAPDGKLLDLTHVTFSRPSRGDSSIRCLRLVYIVGRCTGRKSAPWRGQ
jgi:hypothetical protein